MFTRCSSSAPKFSPSAIHRFRLQSCLKRICIPVMDCPKSPYFWAVAPLFSDPNVDMVRNELRRINFTRIHARSDQIKYARCCIHEILESLVLHVNTKLLRVLRQVNGAQVFAHSLPDHMKCIATSNPASLPPPLPFSTINPTHMALTSLPRLSWWFIHYVRWWVCFDTCAGLCKLPIHPGRRMIRSSGRPTQ